MHGTWLLRALLYSGVIVILSLHGAASAGQQSPPSKPLSSLSEKQLFKMADASYQAGRLEEARQALTLALAKKKKPDKKYSPLLVTINNQLSEREVVKGEAACKKNELETCEKQIAAAKAFATTERVQQLEGAFRQSVSNVREQLSSAVKVAEGGDPETALKQLELLKRFGNYLPNLNAQLGQVRKLFLTKLLSEGNAFVEQHRWDAAASRYQRVLDAAMGHAGAKEGLNRVERGRRAYQLYDRAMNQLAAKNYREALRAVRAASATYPGEKGFDQLAEQVGKEWLRQLLSEIPGLLTEPNNFVATRDAILHLEQARELDPLNAEVRKYLSQASELFGANSLQRSAEFERIVDYSRIATATALRVSAQQHMPPGTIKPEDLKSLAVVFNRKRASQILITVDNLCAASMSFVQTLQVRSRNTAESLALPDLRVRTVEDYQKSPNEDTQFQDLRPDGKSASVLLAVGSVKYLSERHASEKPIEAQSQYVSGTERVPNPDYQRMQAEVDRIRRALEARKKRDKPTPEGWTDLAYQQKLMELSGIERSITKDKLAGYTYQKVEHQQQTTVEVAVLLRDYFSREELAKDTIRFDDKRQATEIDGVRPQDVNGLQNQPVRLPSTEQVLREGERTVLDELEKKIRQILPTYTNRFRDAAEKALKTGQFDEVVEYYLCHWVFMRGKLDLAEAERIAEIVKQQTGFDLVKQGPNLLSITMGATAGTP